MRGSETRECERKLLFQYTVLYENISSVFFKLEVKGIKSCGPLDVRQEKQLSSEFREKGFDCRHLSTCPQDDD